MEPKATCQTNGVEYTKKNVRGEWILSPKENAKFMLKPLKFSIKQSPASSILKQSNNVKHFVHTLWNPCDIVIN